VTAVGVHVSILAGNHTSFVSERYLRDKVLCYGRPA
jgi:hypothetical protein